MKQLNVTLFFKVNNTYEDEDAPSVCDLVDFIYDCVWDQIYECGLEPNGYEIKEVEVNACE